MAATRIGFSRPAGFELGLRNRGISGYYADPFRVLFPVLSECNVVGAHLGPQNLKSRAQNFDLHSSDPQRSGTPNTTSPPLSKTNHRQASRTAVSNMINDRHSLLLPVTDRIVLPEELLAITDRDRSVGMLAENLSLRIQILP